MFVDPVELSEKLISCPSVTPKDEGALEVLKTALESLGFDCLKMTIRQEGHEDVDNLYAQLGKYSENLCFAGHTDVVPAGDVDKWASDPFKAEIRNDILYGRGAVDMKCAIACFVSAVSELIENHKPEFSISLLITGVEEGIAVNGTEKFIAKLTEMGKEISVCIVGEPTNPEILGQMIKIGRRGSISFELTINGIQGHVAYPDLAKNPITILTNILYDLQKWQIDDGNAYFQASNLEVTSIDVNNKTDNLIPAKAKANFNIRFNNEHKGKDLLNKVDSICNIYCSKNEYNLTHRISGESFLTQPGNLSAVMQKVIKEVTGIDAKLSTEGGTSDARFIKNYCPVIEFGLINKTAHKIDECIAVADLYQLKNIYLKFMQNWNF